MNIQLFIPEIILFFLIVAMILTEASRFKEQINIFTINLFIGYLAIILCLVYLFINNKFGILFSEFYVVDGVSVFLKILLTSFSAGLLIFKKVLFFDRNEKQIEFNLFLLGALLGAFMIVSSGSLIVFFIGFQLLALVAQVLAAFRRNEPLALENTFKFIILNTFSVGFMALSLAVIYYKFSTFQISKIVFLITEMNADPFIYFFLFAFLFFSVGFLTYAFPMHYWFYSVLPTAELPAGAFLSFVLPVAGFGFFLRLVLLLLKDLSALPSQWSQVIFFMSLSLILFGLYMASIQNNFKKLLACLYFVRVGAYLFLFLSPSFEKIKILLFLLAGETIVTLGVFVSFGYLNQKISKTTNFKDYLGAFEKDPFAVLGALFFLSVFMGLPPFSIFTGWTLMLREFVLEGSFWVPVFIGAMIMTLYVVLSRIILIMFKNKINIKELSCPKKTNAMQKIFISSLAALVVALSIYTHELLEVSERAIKYLFW